MPGRRLVMYSCPMHIIVTAVLQLAQEIVQLIQKHLRLTADQAHLFFLIVDCSCPMAQPYSLTLYMVRFWWQQQAIGVASERRIQKLPHIR